jgi:hypothetical protein
MQFVILKSNIKKLELIDVILVLNWLISCFITILISINWLQNQYYFPFVIQLGITIIVAFLNGHDPMERLWALNFGNLYYYYFVSCYTGLVCPLRLIFHKEFNLINPYFARKKKEVEYYNIKASVTLLKSSIFIIYTFLGFSIGNINTLPFKLLFAAETLNFFIVTYIRFESITKSVGFFTTCCLALDISSFFLLFFIRDNFFFFNLIVQYIVIVIGNRIIFKRNLKGLLFKSVINTLFRFQSIILVIFAMQVQSGLINENSNYKYIWQFIDTSPKAKLTHKLNVVKNVIAEKMVRECKEEKIVQECKEDKISNALGSCVYANKLLIPSTLDKGCLFTDIIQKTKETTKGNRILLVVSYLSFLVSYIVVIMYPLFMQLEGFIVGYLLYTYKITFVALLISGRCCIPFAKFAYYSRFMCKVSSRLIGLNIDSIKRMRIILDSDIRFDKLCNLNVIEKILPSQLFKIIAEYDKECVLNLKCYKCPCLESSENKE